MVLLHANLNEGAEAPSGVDSEMTAFKTELFNHGQFSSYNGCVELCLQPTIIVEFHCSVFS